MSEILTVDLIAFEKGDQRHRNEIIESTIESLKTGFVYTTHDLNSNLLDRAYEMLAEFFALPNEDKATLTVAGSNGQTGYTGLSVETAANSEVADWKEMLNWGIDLPDRHPLKTRFPTSYLGPTLPEKLIPGISQVLLDFQSSILDLQRRFLRIIAVGIGCHESFFDTITAEGCTLTRAIHYPAMQQAPTKETLWAGAHGDINLITALPRATARGLQVETEQGWVDAAPPADAVIINTGIMLERITNGVIPTGIHRVIADPDQTGERYSVVQFCHPTPWTVLSPVASCISPENPQQFAPITADELLSQVLWQINLIEQDKDAA